MMDQKLDTQKQKTEKAQNHFQNSKKYKAMKTLFTLTTVLLFLGALVAINWLGKQSLPTILIAVAFCASWVCYFYVIITEKEGEK